MRHKLKIANYELRIVQICLSAILILSCILYPVSRILPSPANAGEINELTVHLLLKSSRNGFTIQTTGDSFIQQGTLSIALGKETNLEILHVPGSNRLLLFKGGSLFFSGDELILHSRKDFRLDGQSEAIGSDQGLLLFAADHEAHCVLRIPLPDYLAGVLQGEMGTQAADEALKAQAIASRSYVMHKMASKGITWRNHVPADTRGQVFRSGKVSRRILNAVKSTRGMIIAQQGKPIDAVYSACCGGVTENCADAFGSGGNSALIAQRDHGYLPSFTPDARRNLEITKDSCCRNAPRFRWTRDFTAEQLAEMLGLEKPVDGLSINETTGSGRLQKITITSGSQILRFSGLKLRKYLNLPSSLCYVEHEAGGMSFTFRGGGFGHGAGLCQGGAIGRAQDGKTYKEILAFYYPGTELIQVF